MRQNLGKISLFTCSKVEPQRVKAFANEDTLLLLMMFLGCANARDTKLMLYFHAAQNGKHLLRTQNVSEQNQKHVLCPGHKICVRNKCKPRAPRINVTKSTFTAYINSSFIDTVVMVII